MSLEVLESGKKTAVTATTSSLASATGNNHLEITELGNGKRIIAVQLRKKEAGNGEVNFKFNVTDIASSRAKTVKLKIESTLPPGFEISPIEDLEYRKVFEDQPIRKLNRLDEIDFISGQEFQGLSVIKTSSGQEVFRIELSGLKIPDTNSTKHNKCSFKITSAGTLSRNEDTPSEYHIKCINPNY